MEYPYITEGLNIPPDFDGDALTQVGADDLSKLAEKVTDLN
jgi:hypothetical protein